MANDIDNTTTAPALTAAAGSIPHVGKPTDLDPLQNVLYRNQYGTWTSIMVRALPKDAEWITSDELDDIIRWVRNAAQSIEGWALENTTDLRVQMAGCRGLLEMCPVDFHSSNQRKD